MRLGPAVAGGLQDAVDTGVPHRLHGLGREPAGLLGLVRALAHGIHEPFGPRE